MWGFITGPYFWVSIGVILVAIIVISFIVSKRRENEVAELEKMFPGNVIDTSEKISVEKVRRSTARRRRQNNTQTTQENPKQHKEMDSMNRSDTSPYLPQLDPQSQEVTAESPPTASQRRYRRKELPTSEEEKLKKMNTGSEFTTSSLLRSKRNSKKEHPTQTLSRSSRKPPLKKDSLLDESSSSYTPRRSRFPRT